MLKTSYIESLSKFSPGTVLRWKVIQDLYALGADEHDFLGDADAYKLAWSKKTRRHASVVLYKTGVRSWLVHRLGALRRFSGGGPRVAPRHEPGETAETEQDDRP
jgi:CelD/BcsL family acetyltransferase involved in cellulose biosynthesis